MFLAVNWGNTLIVTLLGFSLVCLVLILLVGVIYVFGLLMTNKITVVKNPKKKAIWQDDVKCEKVHLTTGESAAIAMALYLSAESDIHDTESQVITIKKVERKYSPWSSKIYGINKLDK